MLEFEQVSKESYDVYDRDRVYMGSVICHPLVDRWLYQSTSRSSMMSAEELTEISVFIVEVSK